MSAWTEIAGALTASDELRVEGVVQFSREHLLACRQRKLAWHIALLLPSTGMQEAPCYPTGRAGSEARSIRRVELNVVLGHLHNVVVVHDILLDPLVAERDSSAPEGP